MGFWLLLQNCHLSLTFCEEIMQTVIDSEEIHANFRFVLTRPKLFNPPFNKTSISHGNMLKLCLTTLL